ncbi:aldose 1-epimerase [Ophiostoma piceae UAMH 11346]|uniref:Aldose 1-epimerase n=1 Tax=Ophiostoma piceae (strain UAMH 11346) TaxID=1262450 RepID=S3BX56_OPHP1|nr:aldose 1-epimerase [Ophiostoma piceae UAMH 11346]
MSGSAFTFLARGAIIQHFEIAGIDIVQGFPTTELYDKHNGPYFGETIGRFANRIAGASIQVPGGLNGKDAYPLAANNGPNALHGGHSGWGSKTWDGPTPVGVRQAIPGFAPGDLTTGGESVQFTLVSPDGDEGYPGTVKATVTYSVGKQPLAGSAGEATVLVIEYEAELIDGADETVINMTNHSYFNLGGAPTIEGTVVELGASKYLPIDDGGIPTALVPAVFPKIQANVPFTLGAVEPNVDDCFVVRDAADAKHIDTRALPLNRHLAAHHPDTGIHLEVYSTEPAFQFYTGKFIDVPAVGGLPARGNRAGFCVEPSRYVNAPNVEAWKDMAVLKKGEKYGARIVYRAWKA